MNHLERKSHQLTVIGNCVNVMMRRSGGAL